MKKKLVLLTLSTLLLFSGCGAASGNNSQSISASPAENGYATDGLYFADEAYDEDYTYDESNADTASGTTSQEAKEVCLFPAELNGEILTSRCTPFSDFR